ncbi:unnamed protein product [Rangifer tarandus platyrhynchus]|uniref:Uncharacterized protein n=2 Tax=Rangifer tarandus platyrhynchus TaxID=3082113 RepID=A0ABN8YAW0_RANTA|nr:unnamed protein product [Rangifer tarandus platyrhynchus]CAI9698715.1 unnamed protein product [Rangifer tarandus platyrhynchus]
MGTRKLRSQGSVPVLPSSHHSMEPALGDRPWGALPQRRPRSQTAGTTPSIPVVTRPQAPAPAQLQTWGEDNGEWGMTLGSFWAEPRTPTHAVRTSAVTTGAYARCARRL